MKTEKVSGKLLWEPSKELQNQSNMKKFMAWLEETRGLKFEQYDQLWNWSVTEIEEFWTAIWDFFEIKAKKPYDEVLSSGKMPGVKWFTGAKLNYAEHVFRNEVPEKAAVIYQTETRPQGELTWAELKKEYCCDCEPFKVQLELNPVTGLWAMPPIFMKH